MPVQQLSREMLQNVRFNTDAAYAHCFAHCHELIVKDAIDQCSLLSTSLDLCQSLYAIVGAYRSDFFCLKKFKMTLSTRMKPMNTLFSDSRAYLRQDGQQNPSISADTKGKMKGILKHQLSSLHIFFNLNVERKLIVLLQKFSKELQAVDISADHPLCSVQHILQRLHEMRDNREFQRILDEAKSIHELKKQVLMVLGNEKFQDGWKEETVC